jgi:hypothetical protein
MTGRRDWVQADVRCLLCGRVMGRLVGPVTDAGLLAGQSPAFSAFRPADPNASAVRLGGGEQFRCGTCGGPALMDEVETFSTYDDRDEDVDRPRRGRPPKPWRLRSHEDFLRDLGLAG